ncbi:hypothetical protein Hanom_Chr02g00139091 [Helianthus anomalus]
MKQCVEVLTWNNSIASAKALPSTNIPQTTLLICRDMRIAHEGLLFFSFSISRNCAAFCIAILKEAAAIFLDFCAFTSSFLSLCTCRCKLLAFLLINQKQNLHIASYQCGSSTSYHPKIPFLL